MSYVVFEGNFLPEDYLATYYPLEVGSENQELLSFYNQAFKDASGGKLIEIGGGPTIYQLVSAAPKLDRIIFTDYLEDNLETVRTWQHSLGANCWSNYIKYTLELENPEGYIQQNSIDERAQLIKSKINVVQLDINNSVEVGIINRHFSLFDVVSSSFCIDSITSSFAEWLRLLQNVTSLVKPGGALIMTSLGGSKEGYMVGNKQFPAVNLKLDQILEALNMLKFDKDSFYVKEIPAEPEHAHSYDSLICIKAIRKA